MFKNLLKNDGEFLVFTGNYVEFYIPRDYEENKLAEDEGESYRMFGVCNVRTFDANDKPGKIETLNLPAFITVYPSEIEETNIALVDGQEPVRYKVLKFYKDDKVMRNVTQQDSSNLELFMNLMIRGKLPATIPYDDVVHLWLKNMNINGAHLGVTSTIIEIIISEIYRDAKKRENKFAKTIGSNPSVSPYAYETANIREICARNSTFAALTFEDMDAMITSSLNINKYKKDETISPIEKIIKM